MAEEWSAMTVVQLKAQLTKISLETTGNKADLVKRLQEHDEASVFDQPISDDEAVDEEDDEAVEEDDDKAVEEEDDDEAVEEEDDDEAVEEDDTAPADVKPSTMEPEENTVESSEEAIKPKGDEVKTELVVDLSHEEADDDTTPAAQSMDTDEKEEPTKQESQVVDLSKMTVDELQAELLKREKKKTKWIKFIDGDSNKKLFKDLQKLDKLTCFNNRSKELSKSMQKLILHVYPVSADIMSDPAIMDIVKKCTHFALRLTIPSTDADPIGILDLTFRRQKWLKDALPVLSALKPDIHVVHTPSDESWREDWKKMSQTTTMHMDKNFVFLPSLPQRMTEDDLWELFPKARMAHLIDAKVRKHAYVLFPSAKIIDQTIDELNSQGPPKDYITFCSMLHLYRMVNVLQKNNFITAGQASQYKLGLKYQKKALPVATTTKQQQHEKPSPSSSFKRPFSAGGSPGVSSKRARPSQDSYGAKGRGRASPRGPGAGRARTTGGSYGAAGNRGTGRGSFMGRGAGRGASDNWGGNRYGGGNWQKVVQENTGRQQISYGEQYAANYGDQAQYTGRDDQYNESYGNQYSSGSYQQTQPQEYPDDRLTTAMETLSKLTRLRDIKKMSAPVAEFDHGDVSRRVQNYGDNYFR